MAAAAEWVSASVRWRPHSAEAHSAEGPWRCRAKALWWKILCWKVLAAEGPSLSPQPKGLGGPDRLCPPLQGEGTQGVEPDPWRKTEDLGPQT